MLIRNTSKYEYRVITKEQAEIFIKNNKLIKSGESPEPGFVNYFSQYWYNYESKYNYKDSAGYNIAQLLVRFFSKDNNIETYMILDDIYKKMFDIKNITNYQDADIVKLDGKIERGRYEALEQFIEVPQEEFNKYLKEYPRDLIHIESAVIDEVLGIYFDPSYEEERKSFCMDIGDYGFPRVIFRWAVSGPAMTALYYINKFYMDLINKGEKF